MVQGYSCVAYVNNIPQGWQKSTSTKIAKSNFHIAPQSAGKAVCYLVTFAGCSVAVLAWR